MRLAAYQGPSPAGDAGAAFAEIRRFLAAAAAAGADMGVMPELFLPGYNHEPMHADPEWPAMLSDVAKAAGVGLVIGLAEMIDGAMENVAHAYGPDGALLARYSKIQQWGPRERGHFRRGEAPVSFDFAGRKIGLMICYDVEFPERVREYHRAGCDLILAPTANPDPFDNVARFVVPGQAAISGMAFAYINFCGEERGATFSGHSIICGPDGETLAAAGRGPAILIADLPGPFEEKAIPLSAQLDDLVER